MDCTQFIINVIYDSNSIKHSWYAYCIRTKSVPEQNCTIETAYCQTIWHDKWQCDVCTDNKCKNTFQEKYKTRETPGPRTVTTHSAKWHSVRILTTFITHHICAKLKIFAQICFGLQIFQSGFNKVYLALLLKEYCVFLDFKLSPCVKWNMFSFGDFPGVWVLIADVSEHCIGAIFKGRSMKYFIDLPLKMEPIQYCVLCGTQKSITVFTKGAIRPYPATD
jgi:hypothetical protein